MKKINIYEHDINAILELIKNRKLKEATKKFFLFKLDRYIKKLDDIDKQILQEKKTPEEFWHEFNKQSLNIVKEGDKITSQIGNRIIIKQIKDKFRKFIGPWLYKGKMMKRGYEKPRGYPGDYKMLEGIYDNKPWTKEGIGYLSDMLLLNDEYVISVKKRKDTMKKILQDFLFIRKIPEVSIMNLGCGSAREVREILSPKSNFGKRINFTFLDQDEEALKFVRKQIKRLNLPFLNCNYVKENLISFIRKIDRYQNEIGKQDLIYVIGVVDYLPDEIYKNLIRACSKLLRNQGIFVIAYKLVKKIKSINSDWFCNWYFYERDEQKIIQMTREELEEDEFKLRFIDLREKRIHFIGIERI